MPPRPRWTRAVAALVFAASCLTTAAAPALALDPPRPLPGYRPTFVTEREPGKWEDCTWSAASMLLDKWTNGATRVGREKLRKLSGDLEGGSNLADVARAFDKLGFTLPWSPNGGASITWPELLERLEQGGGAIIGGDYGDLPRHYGRWAPDTWAGELDDHALYLDAYDPTRGRILVMDPLAPAGWAGEWIPAKAIKAFAWHGRGGALWTAVTPAALPPPFSGVTFGAATVEADSTALRLGWPVEAAPAGWAFPGATVTPTVTPIAELGRADVVVSALPANLDVPPLPGPAIDVEGERLVAAAPLPTTPGIYRVSVSVTDHRTGAQVVAAGPFSLFVPGPRAARFVLPEATAAEAGRFTPISFGLSNVGTVSWQDPDLPPTANLDVERLHNTRLVGRWVREDLPLGEALPDVVELASVPLGPVRLEPGYGQRVEAILRVPTEPGLWRFIVDIMDDQEGSFALAGSAPGVIVIEVLAPAPTADKQ